MSTARFARSGRLRICILMSMFLVLIMMIVIYHMSQHQLDESRAYQEGLSEKLQSLNEQKFAAEKKVNLIRSEKVSLQQTYDARLAQAEQQHLQTQRVLSEKYEALMSKHADLESEYVKSKKQNLDDTNAFEQKLQTLLAELQKDKATKEQEVAAWKDKYDSLQRESSHKAHSLEAALIEYKAHCSYVPQAQPAEAPQQQLNKPVSHTAETTRNSSPARMAHSIDKPRNQKSFDQQVQIAPKTLKTSVDETETQLKQQEEPAGFNAANVGSASPLSAPSKLSSTASTAAKPAPLNASVASFKPSSSGLPPLAMPPPKPLERKLPENVAPIPDNFEDKADNKGDTIDVDTAAEELPKNENNKNNRYANAVNDMEHGKALGVAPKPNEDSGAHEVKDTLNEQNFNLPAAAAAERHFFDGDLAPGQAAGLSEDNNKHLDAQANNGDDDDDIMDNVADVAVKQPQNLLEADNLNNEIAGDQGKEFPEGLHLDDGMEEDQDEDDYSVGAAHKPGGEVIRH